MCREKNSLPDCNLLTAHVVSWFFDLNNDRDYNIFAGMGGGGAIPKALGYKDIAAWAQLTGNEPTRWEVAALREMDKAWRGAYDQKAGTGNGKQHQAIGEYCKGAEVESCRKTFGDALERICATCPN